MSTKKLRRNDPCHCGSGKKYKKCCMTTVTARSSWSEAADLEWRKLRQLEGAVFDKHLIPYVTKMLPDEVMVQAIVDCLPDDLPEALDRALLFNNFFLPWSLFNWIPFDDFGVKKFNSELTLSQNYLLSHEKKLNSQERRFIDAMNQTYYSFYSVLSVEIDRADHVKDILLETTHALKEHQGTHFLKKGDLIFSRILTLDKQSIFVGMAPFTIPIDYHHSLLDFKKWLIKEENANAPLTSEILRHELDIDVLDYFFELLETAYNRPLPTLVNTEGALILDTNSQERTQRAKKRLAKYLGKTITFQQTLIESPTQKIKSLPEGVGAQMSQSELIALPEVQTQLKAMVEAHWKNWFDEPIQMLDNKTPREAAKTKEGQEQLEALFLQYERHSDNTSERSNDLLKVDIAYLRKELALN